MYHHLLSWAILSWMEFSLFIFEMVIFRCQFHWLPGLQRKPLGMSVRVFLDEMSISPFTPHGKSCCWSIERTLLIEFYLCEHFLNSLQITNSCRFFNISLLAVESSDLYAKKQIVSDAQIKQNAFTFVNILSRSIIVLPLLFLFLILSLPLSLF